MKGIKNEKTGSYLNYYLMYITDPVIRKVLNDKWLERWVNFFPFALTLVVIDVIIAIMAYLN